MPLCEVEDTHEGQYDDRRMGKAVTDPAVRTAAV